MRGTEPGKIAGVGIPDLDQNFVKARQQARRSNTE